MQRIAFAVLPIAVATSLAGCVIDEKHYLGPFDCPKQSGAPAPDPTTISGFVRADFNPEVGQSGPVSGATVEAFLIENKTTRIAFTTSGDNGSFKIQYPTGNSARSVFLTVSASPFMPTLYYPVGPVTDDINGVTLEMFSESGAIDFAKFLGIQSVDFNKDLFAVSVENCTGVALGGAIVSTIQPGMERVHYLADTMDGPVPLPSAMSTDSTYGLAIAVNVPVDNSTIIHATAPKPGDPSTIVVLHDRVIPPAPGALIQVDIEP